MAPVGPPDDVRSENPKGRRYIGSHTGGLLRRSVVPLKVALIDNKVEIDELVHTSMANSSPLLFIPIFHPSTQLPGQG